MHNVTIAYTKTIQRKYNYSAYVPIVHKTSVCRRHVYLFSSGKLCALILSDIASYKTKQNSISNYTFA